MTGLFRSVCAVAISLALTIPVAAATFVAPHVEPPTIQSPGQDYLSDDTDLGAPGLFWFITLVEWEQTSEIAIEVGVSSQPGDTGQEQTHLVFLTLSNITPDNWSRFELVVEGPATFSDPIDAPVMMISPVGPGVTAAADTAITFDDLTWIPGNFAEVTFGLDVVPPAASEPVVLTLRPIAVPEPSSGLLIALGALLMQRRHRRV